MYAAKMSWSRFFFFYFIRPIHSRHYKGHESTFYVKRDFFTQFLDRSNWENHWSHYTFDFQITSGLFSLVRCIDLKVFRLSLINYNTFLFHSALVNHYIAKSATLTKRAVFTGWRCDRLLVFLSIRTDWVVLQTIHAIKAFCAPLAILNELTLVEVLYSKILSLIIDTLSILLTCFAIYSVEWTWPLCTAKHSGK